MNPVSLLNKPVVQSTAADCAKMANEVARLNKRFALELVADGNVRGNVTAGDIMKWANEDISNQYDRAGNLTEKGVREFINHLKFFLGIDEEAAKKVTIGDYIKFCLKEYEKENPFSTAEVFRRNEIAEATANKTSKTAFSTIA